jgi:hypothetical protein
VGDVELTKRQYLHHNNNASTHTTTATIAKTTTITVILLLLIYLPVLALKPKGIETKILGHIVTVLE